MMCLVCSRLGPPLCGTCTARLVAAVPRLVPPDLVVAAAFRHSGVARVLVHDLKYRGVVGPASVLAPAMAAVLPQAGAALVPVPRALNRRVRFGVDPALELARAVGRLTGLPVHQGLRSWAWRSHHAGKQRDRRAPVSFLRAGASRPGLVIVDDVITTGATLAAARRALGGDVVGAIVATNAGV